MITTKKVVATITIVMAVVIAVVAFSRLHPLKVSPIRPNVRTAELGTEFMVRVGGGTNISPPEPFGGGDGIPLVSIANGSAFMPGEVRAQDERTKLIKIICDFENPSDHEESFKIGDVALVVGYDRVSDFNAVGYDDRLCSMPKDERKFVKEIVVRVPAKETRALAYIFPLAKDSSTNVSIVIGGSTPVPLKISQP